jgi:hypothetical protein
MKSAVREENCDLRSGSEIGLSHPPLEQEEAGACMQSSERAPAITLVLSYSRGEGLPQ